MVKAREFVARRWVAPERPSSCCGDASQQASCRPSVTEGASCGSGATKEPSCCPGEPSADSFDAFLDRLRTHRFTLTAMAFQDVWNVDLERLRDCCVHVVSPQGTIVPFCSWNLTGSGGEPLHRRS